MCVYGSVPLCPIWGMALNAVQTREQEQRKWSLKTQELGKRTSMHFEHFSFQLQKSWVLQYKLSCNLYGDRIFNKVQLWQNSFGFFGRRLLATQNTCPFKCQGIFWAPAAGRDRVRISSWSGSTVRLDESFFCGKRTPMGHSRVTTQSIFLS